ncbi:MAG TPA: amidohydrolase [Kofleriaceae bacterium]|jgi:aminobenzoyl-glutamate utilization protein B|nr:amidohydrolase [Kofleriaceae bacterium]
MSSLIQRAALCLICVAGLLGPRAKLARADGRATDVYLDQTRERWERVARQIWDTPELGLKETRSSAALIDILQKEGFQITRGVGGEPTAFIATAGSGEPVIGLLAEYDALPGLSQAAGQARKQAVSDGAPGHGCGHNLLGTASVAAAIAANRERIARKLPGTIQLFGTPAEEILFGKTFMIRGGAFDHTGAVFAWHPDDQNRVPNRTRLAVAAANVEFFGRSAHAAAAPWLGRSSLDALTLFDHAIALMREHIKPTARIHRMIREGGAAPNIIPDYTLGEYWIRDATGESVNEMMERLKKAAEGAGLATETRAKVTLTFSTREPVPNDALDAVLQKELERIGPPKFDDTDQKFARAMQKELGFEQLGMATAVMPYAQKNGGTASSDIGEVSAAVPLSELNLATRPLGTAAHHWAQTACAAHPVGYKGMAVAAKVLAASAVDALTDPGIVKAARDAFGVQTKGKPYVSPLPAGAKPVAPR